MNRFVLLIEGRVLETIPECGARCGVLRCGSQPRPGRSGTPPAGHYDPAARSSLHGLRRKCRRRKRGPRPKIATVERRKARVLRYWTQGASQAPGRAALWHVQPGAAAPGRLSALRPPLGVGLSFKTRAKLRRGNEVCCAHGLFDK